MRQKRAARPATAPHSFRCLIVSLTVGYVVLCRSPPEPDFFLEIERAPLSSRELSILMVIFNKGQYLSRSLSSILRLSLSRRRYEVLCVDDGSTDNSTRVVALFQAIEPHIHLHKLPQNRGTHIARITAVRLARTPFLTFLDPDDEFTGEGLRLALDKIILTGADIVEFGCHTVVGNKTVKRCWMPPRVREANPNYLARLFYRGKINPHVHRKIFRSQLYKDAIDAMPEYVLESRILRYEDKLHFAFILDRMRRKYYYIRVLGEFRYWGLEDNSQSANYQSVNASVQNDIFVNSVINRTFGRVAK
jgi:glycosyltransferase involved in cell wall biosynthesis